MRNRLLAILTVLVLAGAAPLLGACNTTAGAGEDISATGHTITNTAEQANPQNH
jgi:predicted small secreted protein